MRFEVRSPPYCIVSALDNFEPSERNTDLHGFGSLHFVLLVLVLVVVCLFVLDRVSLCNSE